ncbi:DUF6270 domain-containing protein [Nocardioides caeni]|uniref:Uncharacterized protein n=1 Tax=Nocardioides caeni TaxID=574700 RepID=A0A4S8N9E1_9ACTN|nr:DUF6270 domain-containing protein [Nocardioides caeni]THV12928.1 hypothetical protein E9934_11135 [Nocardioides caeni]
MRVAILGSCVSRDAFGIHEDVLGKPHRYFARSGLASALCPTPVHGLDLSAITSAFQRSVVAMDLEKAFVPWLETADFDLLVLDCIDERFALLREPGGALVTRSSEFAAAGVDISGWEVVRPNSEQFFDLWEEAWGRFVEVLDATGTRDRVRINRVRWATAFDGPGAEFPAFYGPQRIRRSNEFLERAYARMAQDLTPEQFWTYDDHELLATTEHQWGPAPFHYTPAFYRRFVHHLTGIELPSPRRSLRQRWVDRRGPGR